MAKGKYGDTILIPRAAATRDVEHSARNEYRVPVFPYCEGSDRASYRLSPQYFESLRQPRS